MVYTKATKDGLIPYSGAVTRKENLPQFDLSKINVVQLAQDLSRQIQTPQPKGWLSKWWTNKKLPYDNDRIGHLTDYVRRVREINSEITEMQYQLYIQPKVLENLIQGYELEAMRQADIQVAEHERQIAEINEQRKRDEEETLLLKAQVNKAVNEARMVGLQADLLDKIITELDINNITPEQAFVLVKALNPEASANVDFASQQLMLEAQIDRMKAETLKKKYEAEREAQQSRLEKYDVDKTIESNK